MLFSLSLILSLSLLFFSRYTEETFPRTKGLITVTWLSTPMVSLGCDPLSHSPCVLSPFYFSSFIASLFFRHTPDLCEWRTDFRNLLTRRERRTYAKEAHHFLTTLPPPSIARGVVGWLLTLLTRSKLLLLDILQKGGIWCEKEVCREWKLRVCDRRCWTLDLWTVDRWIYWVPFGLQIVGS